MITVDGTAYTFRAVQFMAKHDKELVLKQWRLFLDSGFDRAKFTKRLYQHLILHCSFIAHYNINGFWVHYFAPGNEIRQLAFIRQFNRGENPAGKAAELNMAYWVRGHEYSDINRAMIDVMTKRASQLKDVIECTREANMVTEIARLQAALREQRANA